MAVCWEIFSSRRDKLETKALTKEKVWRRDDTLLRLSRNGDKCHIRTLFNEATSWNFVVGVDSEKKFQVNIFTSTFMVGNEWSQQEFGVKKSSRRAEIIRLLPIQLFECFGVLGWLTLAAHATDAIVLWPSSFMWEALSLASLHKYGLCSHSMARWEFYDVLANKFSMKQLRPES